jgi:hypothetical protein
MSKDPRTQRHQPPTPSRWLILMKAVIAAGKVVSFVTFLMKHHE